MNDRARFFCQLTALTHVVSADGGGRPDGTACRPHGMGVDWILGTTTLSFTGYTSTRQPPIDRATDHPLVYADVGFGPSGPY
jgi:hypothetical protein